MNPTDSNFLLQPTGRTIDPPEFFCIVTNVITFFIIGVAVAGRIIVYRAPPAFLGKIVAMCASAIEFFEYQSPHFAATP